MNRYMYPIHGSMAMAITAAAVMLCMTGCLSTYLNDKTAGADGKTSKEVTFYRGGFVTSTTMDSAEVNYNGVTAKLGNYSSKGDAEMGDVITAGIIGGILAYGTGGTSAVGSGVLAGITKARKEQAVTQTDVTTAEPEASPGEATPPRQVPATDVVAGKNAVVVIGDRAKCGLCRALWQPGFEESVEKAMPQVDVIDADLRDAPALYGKYRPKGSFSYPLAQVYGADGKMIGSFVARGMNVEQFKAKVVEICHGCGAE
jgi:hypothetical protein